MNPQTRISQIVAAKSGARAAGALVVAAIVAVPFARTPAYAQSQSVQVNPPMPNMQPVGAPNMFGPNGQINQPYQNLPNAFNWHPYMPGVPADTGSGAPPQQSTIFFFPTHDHDYDRDRDHDHDHDGDRDHRWPVYQGNGFSYSYSTWGAQPGSYYYWQSDQPTRPISPIPPDNERPDRHEHPHPPADSNQPTFIRNQTITLIPDDGPPILLGGFYYPNYCDEASGPNIYPSIYSMYGGIPSYIYQPGPGITVLGEPYYPRYDTSYVPFTTPVYQVTYNQYNYYTSNPEAAEAIQDGGDHAKRAIKSAYSEDTYQAAFADIEQAWNTGNIGLIRKHLRDNDTKISVLLNRKYAYSISSDDFAQITRDAMKKLDTVSFKFTRLRKAGNGDVTAYGLHVYEPSAVAENDKSDDTVAFDTQAAPSSDNSSESAAYDSQGASGSTENSGDAKPGEHKVMYVSYTLRKDDDGWVIVLVDSSKNKLVPSQTDENGG